MSGVRAGGAKAATPRRGLADDGFVAGLTRPSALAVAVAAAVAALALAALCLLVTPSRVAGAGAALFAKSDIDDDAFVTGKVLALQRSDDPRPLVAILGASVTRESFGPEERIAADLRAAVGVDVEVRVLCTSRQYSWEHAALADAIASDRPTIVVTGVGPGRFSTTVEELSDVWRHPRLGFVSSALDEEAALAGLAQASRTGIYVLDNLAFFLPRLLAAAQALIVGPVPGLRDRYTGRRMAEGPSAERDRLVAARLATYDAARPINRAVFERMFARHADKPIRYALVEHVLNPAFLKAHVGGAFHDRHRRETAEWAAAQGVAYWPLQQGVALTDANFYDWAHLNDAAARDRLRAALVARLAEIMR